jgi:thiamine pyrophosphokinase
MRTSNSDVLSFHLGRWQLTANNLWGNLSILLIAGGQAPSVEWLAQISPLFQEIWCADSGIEICKKAQIIPHRLIGDSDSSSLEGRAWAEENGVRIETYPVDKDYTDLQLTLKRIGETYPDAKVVITGCWGGRLDHTWSNIYSALWAQEWNVHVVSLCDHKEALFLLNGPDKATFHFELPYPNIVSLFALDEKAEGVFIRGTHWELQNVLLKITHPYAISNRLKKDYLQVDVDKGRLAVYLYWAE